ncbi:MAG TPA: hypothetical protein VFF30_06160 [Nitrososphaerales archaeon]|nr:hypothetical protein [Nitrososphaerales archaeon]
MRYQCRNCQLAFETKGEADEHEYESGHRVELMVASTYWGAHLIAH